MSLAATTSFCDCQVTANLSASTRAITNLTTITISPFSKENQLPQGTRNFPTATSAPCTTTFTDSKSILQFPAAMTSFPAYSRTKIILRRSGSRTAITTSLVSKEVQFPSATGTFPHSPQHPHLHSYKQLCSPGRQAKTSTLLPLSPSFNHLRCQGHSSVPPPHVQPLTSSVFSSLYNP
ncbi:hypothetical protein MHYP_G00108760 [Metynnis hypsauchen]